MGQIINPDMVTLARESRGYSQSKLATKIGIAQGTISKIEMGLFTPDEKLLDQFSHVLEYPKSLFFEEGHIYPPVSTQYRKKSSILKKSIQKQVEASANFITRHIQKLLKSVDLEPAKAILNICLEDSHAKPQDVARLVRMNWKLPRGPIANLTKVLEDVGIIIVPLDFGTDLIDGFRLNIDSSFNVIFVNKSLPGCRLRFTLAHELGHLVMHTLPTDLNQIELEANLFASEFLMPKDDICYQIDSKTDIARLADLKKYWKTSMQAILYAAKRMSLISENRYKYLIIQMGELGYRKHEPIDIPFETPTLLKNLLKVHLSELGFSASELAHSLNILEQDLRRIYFEQPSFRLLTNN